MKVSDMMHKVIKPEFVFSFTTYKSRFQGERGGNHISTADGSPLKIASISR